MSERRCGLERYKLWDIRLEYRYRVNVGLLRALLLADLTAGKTAVYNALDSDSLGIYLGKAEVKAVSLSYERYVENVWCRPKHAWILS